MKYLSLSTFSSVLLLGLFMTHSVVGEESHTHEHNDHAHEHGYAHDHNHAHEAPEKDQKAHDDHGHDHHNHGHSSKETPEPAPETTSEPAADKHDEHDHHNHKDEHKADDHHEHNDHADGHAHDHNHAHDETRTQHGTHEHGTAQLMVSLSEQQLDIVLETPAMNLLGFEHTPKTEEQHTKIAETQQRLKQVETLLIPASAANCTLKDYKAESPLFTEKAPTTDTKASKATKDQPADDKNVHNDILVTWQWQCADMKKLDQVDVKLFSAFPQGFQRLNVEWINADKASAVRLTGDDAVMFR